MGLGFYEMDVAHVTCQKSWEETCSNGIKVCKERKG